MAIGNTMKDKELLTGVRIVDKVNVRDEGGASRISCVVLSQLVCVGRQDRATQITNAKLGFEMTSPESQNSISRRPLRKPSDGN